MASLGNIRKEIPLIFTVSVLYLSGASGFAAFRTLIPNGESVPHPCNPNYIWEGVGHIARGGGGQRNQFGLDFFNQGKSWTVELCQTDSDGDGKTNGEELGDPDCVWVQGAQPSRTTGLSHPGICDPLDSETCQGEPAPNCEEAEFKCEAINEVDVISMDVTIPETPVPPRETTYTCMYFELPQDNDYHLIASKPIIDNINVMHHILVYACADPDAVTEELNTPKDCFMGARACSDIIAGWAVGVNGECFNPMAGFRIGSNAMGYKLAMIELHWNNPAFVDGYTDSSGMQLYLTPSLRPYDAGVLMIGQMLLHIPPQTQNHTATGICSSSCTREIMTGPINIVSATNHMHYLGRSAVSQVVIPNAGVEYLANDPVFNYDRPVNYQFQEPIRVERGHELQLKCHFTSTSRTKTTTYGEGTNDEMCFTFLTYYPKENLKRSDCVSFNDVDVCEFDLPVVRGCNKTMIFDGQHPDNVARYMALEENCAIGYCKKECIAVVKEINQHPCYSGTFRELLLSTIEGIPDSDRVYVDRFWGRLQSCDAEILKQEYASIISGSGDTNASVAPLANVAAMVCMMVLYMLL